ncbi:hypothetical protein FEDK69T_20440 [Flavobacterium enshiense DK69]|nr:hypothetical protein FEDK69T_20440 [Flavobacterium enshiense DK69]
MFLSIQSKGGFAIRAHKENKKIKYVSNGIRDTGMGDLSILFLFTKLSHCLS